MARTTKKKPTRPIYMTARRLVDPDTGEVIGALVPSSDIDSYLLRQKRCRTGEEVRVEVKKPRNAKFHRLVHVLGQMMVENVEAFADTTTHEAIKRLQREAGLFCEEQEIDIPGIGKLLVKVAQSLAFDEMDEGDFRRLWEGICHHVAMTYWPGLTPEQVEQMAGVMPEGVAA